MSFAPVEPSRSPLSYPLIPLELSNPIQPTNLTNHTNLDTDKNRTHSLFSTNLENPLFSKNLSHPSFSSNLPHAILDPSMQSTTPIRSGRTSAATTRRMDMLTQGTSEEESTGEFGELEVGNGEIGPWRCTSLESQQSRSSFSSAFMRDDRMIMENVSMVGEADLDGEDSSFLNGAQMATVVGRMSMELKSREKNADEMNGLTEQRSEMMYLLSPKAKKTFGSAEVPVPIATKPKAIGLQKMTFLPVIQEQAKAKLNHVTVLPDTNGSAFTRPDKVLFSGVGPGNAFLTREGSGSSTLPRSKGFRNVQMAMSLANRSSPLPCMNMDVDNGHEKREMASRSPASFRAPDYNSLYGRSFMASSPPSISNISPSPSFGKSFASLVSPSYSFPTRGASSPIRVEVCGFQFLFIMKAVQASYDFHSLLASAGSAFSCITFDCCGTATTAFSHPIHFIPFFFGT